MSSYMPLTMLGTIDSFHSGVMHVTVFAQTDTSELFEVERSCFPSLGLVGWMQYFVSLDVHAHSSDFVKIVFCPPTPTFPHAS